MCIKLQQEAHVYWSYETLCQNIPVFK